MSTPAAAASTGCEAASTPVTKVASSAISVVRPGSASCDLVYDSAVSVITPSAAAASSTTELLRAASTPISAVMAKVRTPAAAGVLSVPGAPFALDADQQPGAKGNQDGRGFFGQCPASRDCMTAA